MLGLLVGGVVLSNAFRNAALDSFDSSLEADMDGLIAAADPDPDGGVSLQERFLNHRFDRVYSGLYYQIKPGGPGATGGQISRSLFDKEIMPTGLAKSGPFTWGQAVGPYNQHLRVLAQRVEFPITATATPNDTSTYTFLVAGDLAEVDRHTREFNGILLWSFLLLARGWWRRSSSRCASGFSRCGG